MGVLHILGGIVLLLAPQMATHHWDGAPATGAFAFLKEAPFIGCLLVHMLFYMPTLGLSNTVAFHAMSNPEKQFPLVRVWGTIGWIVAGLCVSWLGVDRGDRALDALGGMNVGQYHLAGAAAIVLGLYSFTLPHTPPPARGKPFSARDALGLDALALLRRPAFAVFIVCSLLVCIPLSAYYSYAGTFVGNQGTDVKVGAVMSRGQMSEVFFMIVMPLCFARLGVKWVLAVGMLAWVVRYALFSYAAGHAPPTHAGYIGMITGDPHVAISILLGILLHGVCYDFFFVAGSIYTEQEAPKELRASAQGFLVLITQGLGMLIGAQTAGWLFARTGEGKDWHTFWLWPCLFALGVLVMFVLAFHHRSKAAASTG
jgi:nucleoside transporter